MLDPLLRPLKDRALAPLARRLPGVHPNALTGASLAAGLGAAAAAWYGAFAPAFALWVVNRLLDGLDGLVARRHGRATDLGGYLDLVADFAVYAAIPVALALRPGADPGLPAAAVLLLAAFYVNATAWMVLTATLEKRGRGAAVRGEPTSVSIPEGLVSGSETVVLYGLFFLLPDRLVLLFHLLAVLVALTIGQRVVWAMRTLAT